ncbi:hypothetical protein [Streptomyces sp. NPDC127112]|uniref:hypothetical protein n=1 Tax=Streptomyces sp. NPDC127112 TaxID=3345364 RepID=UPI0036412AA1
MDAKIGGFPFGQDGGTVSLEWRRTLDNWLAAVGADIFQEVPFRLGLIGFELSGETDAEQLNGHAPEERWEGYLLPTGGRLRFDPANR